MIKQKKKRFKLLDFTIIIFVIAILFFGASTVLLKAYDNSLIELKQEMETEMKELEIVNEKIINDIKLIDSENKLNIEQLIAETKLSNNPDNIVEIDTSND